MITPPRCPHVLVVDDAPEIRELLCEVLEDEGYQVTSAASVQDMSDVRDLAPDLIVHDLRFAAHTPTAWAFLDELRQDPQVGQVPVILCTADGRIHSDPTWAHHAEHLGVRVVSKPFDLTDFLGHLTSVLSDQGDNALIAGA